MPSKFADEGGSADFAESSIDPMADDGNDVLVEGSRVGAMRQVFLFLVAASLLIHAVLGCCWHQSHDEAGCDESRPSLAAGPGCCKEHPNTPDQHRSHGPCKDRSHCRGVCSYLPVQKTQVGKALSLVPIDVVAIDPVTRISQVTDHICVARTCELAPEPPVRLHLFHQILLI